MSSFWAHTYCIKIEWKIVTLVLLFNARSVHNWNYPRCPTIWYWLCAILTYSYYSLLNVALCRQWVCCGTVWRTSTRVSIRSSTTERRRNSATRSSKRAAADVLEIDATQPMRRRCPTSAVLAWLLGWPRTAVDTPAAPLFSRRQCRRRQIPFRSRPAPWNTCQRRRGRQPPPPQSRRSSVIAGQLICWSCPLPIHSTRLRPCFARWCHVLCNEREWLRCTLLTSWQTRLLRITLFTNIGERQFTLFRSHSEPRVHATWHGHHPLQAPSTPPLPQWHTGSGWRCRDHSAVSLSASDICRCCRSWTKATSTTRVRILWCTLVISAVFNARNMPHSVSFFSKHLNRCHHPNRATTG